MSEVRHGKDVGQVLSELFEVLESRRGQVDVGGESYTAQLLAGPEDRLLKKIGEEATEVVMAAKDADAVQLRYEIADLLYHVMVVMVRYGLTLDDVADELAGRRKS
ncbi:MAG: phosphoribosyl-ATP diphosphatase [Actinobacteria bacterium]|nr:phosphoribosyl-ATP diphosphatase [Actinomycetota bacterium]MCL5887243.1 phosphoribosyl-ATP diphosphatase [Actinomycetota bacterium]